MIMEQHYRPQNDWDEMVKWRQRDHNTCADTLCNLALNTRTSETKKTGQNHSPQHTQELLYSPHRWGMQAQKGLVDRRYNTVYKR